jgi:hypothetical protein
MASLTDLGTSDSRQWTEASDERQETNLRILLSNQLLERLVAGRDCVEEEMETEVVSG